ncbi:anti-sigma factor [Puniceicoccaceae bacterium K14]|nr:anti-sigma factor [Puniceicoccaceae bacterium K14]
MSEEYLEEKAVQYALGTLPEDEMAEFESSLLADRELQDLVHGFQEVNEFGAKQAKQAEVPFQLYSRVMGEIDAEIEEAEENSLSESSKAQPKIVQFVSWGGWAAAACLLLVLGLKAFDPTSASPSNEPGNLARADILLSELNRPGFEATPQAIANIREQMSLDERMIELAELAEAYWFSYDGLPPEGEFAENSEVESSRGFTLFDSKYRIGFIGIENLPSEEDGKGYHVWAQTASSQPVRAGTLRPGRNSRGLFFFDLSEGEEHVKLDGAVSFFVTEETIERPEQPSDRVILSGI